MTFQASRRSYTFDIAFQFKDAGLVAASAAAQVGGSDKIIFVDDTFIKAVMQIDVSAIEIGSNDELYILQVDGSASSSFASGIANLASLRLGSAGGLGTNYADCAVGKYELPFLNVQNGVQYPYLRMYTRISGTIATGINYTAFAGLDC